jgi:hypothetical protein
MSEEHWLLTEVLKGMQADKWEERAEEAKTLAQEARKAEASVRTKGKRVEEIERILESVFRVEAIDEMGLLNELHITREEIASGRRKVVSRKLEFAEALSGWKEEMEAEKQECEEEIAERERFAKSLEGRLKSIEELLDSRWLHDEEREEAGEVVV